MSESGGSGDLSYGSCDITITGAVQHAYRSGGGAANVATVYWMTDDELRAYFTWKAREETKLQLGEEDIPLFVDQAMARNPRFTTLLIRCPSEHATITLVPGLGSRYEDVPFRPGTYSIAPSIEVDQTVPGLFVAQVVMAVGDRVVTYTPTGVGALQVTAFDTAHLAGDFSFEAQDGEATIVVDGVFDYQRQPVDVDGS